MSYWFLSRLSFPLQAALDESVRSRFRDSLDQPALYAQRGPIERLRKPSAFLGIQEHEGRPLVRLGPGQSAHGQQKRVTHRDLEASDRGEVFGRLFLIRQLFDMVNEGPHVLPLGLDLLDERQEVFVVLKSLQVSHALFVGDAI